jgi:hypothetical protein
MISLRKRNMNTATLILYESNLFHVSYLVLQVIHFENLNSYYSVAQVSPLAALKFILCSYHPRRALFVPYYLLCHPSHLHP